MQSFDVYFSGEMLPEADPAAVRHGVARLFKVQESAIERLFSGRPLRVKQAVDADAASLYRAAFRDVGALVQIVPAGAPPPAPRAPAPPPRAAQRALDVDRDRAPPPSQGDIAAAGLAEPGAIIDSTPPPPPARIDTGALEALPPNTGTLEDCRVEKPHRQIPDISHLRLLGD